MSNPAAQQIISDLAAMLHSFAHEAIEQDKEVHHGDPTVCDLDEKWAKEILEEISLQQQDRIAKLEKELRDSLNAYLAIGEEDRKERKRLKTELAQLEEHFKEMNTHRTEMIIEALDAKRELVIERDLNNRLRAAMESERVKYTATISDHENTIVSQQEELWRLRKELQK